MKDKLHHRAAEDARLAEAAQWTLRGPSGTASDDGKLAAWLEQGEANRDAYNKTQHALSLVDAVAGRLSEGFSHDTERGHEDAELARLTLRLQGMRETAQADLAPQVHRSARFGFAKAFAAIAATVALFMIG